MSRTWSMDPKPGPEVTKVRDAHGVVWRRRPGDKLLWWGDIGHGYDDYRGWPDLLARGPLTDATNEPD